MKPIKRQHLVATIFPASLLEAVKEQSQKHAGSGTDEVVFLTGVQSISGRRVRLIAEEFVRAGKTIRVVRKL